MVIVSNIDGEFEVEEQQAAAVELMCANLTPQVAEFTREAQAFERQQGIGRGAMPADLAGVEVEVFLSRMYAAQE